MRESSAQKRRALCLGRLGGEPRHSEDEEGDHNLLLLSFIHLVLSCLGWLMGENRRSFWERKSLTKNINDYHQLCLTRSLTLEDHYHGKGSKAGICIHWWRAPSVLIAKAKVIICKDSSCLATDIQLNLLAMGKE